jgi:hypothetical protein
MPTEVYHCIEFYNNNVIDSLSHSCSGLICMEVGGEFRDFLSIPNLVDRFMDQQAAANSAALEPCSFDVWPLLTVLAAGCIVRADLQPGSLINFCEMQSCDETRCSNSCGPVMIGDCLFAAWMRDDDNGGATNGSLIAFHNSL